MGGWGGTTPQGTVRTHRGGDVDEEGVAVDAHRLQEGVASHLPLVPLPPGQESPQSHGHQPGVQEDDQRRYRHCRTKNGTGREDGARPRLARSKAIIGAAGAGPTSVELRPVVVRGVAQPAEEGGQVAADGYREHQGHADPERTYNTHKHS